MTLTYEEQLVERLNKPFTTSKTNLEEVRELHREVAAYFKHVKEPTTRSEMLSALPVGAVIRTDRGEIFERVALLDGTIRWAAISTSTVYPDPDIVLPATVLYVPEELGETSTELIEARKMEEKATEIRKEIESLPRKIGSVIVSNNGTEWVRVGDDAWRDVATLGISVSSFHVIRRPWTLK